MLRLLFSLIFLLLVCNIQAQDKSNRGREFWLGYGFNYKFFNELPLNNQELAIYISTEQAATVTVSINNTTWSQTLNIPANTVDASILIPKSGVNDARILTDGLSSRGIHIESNVPVAAYAHVFGPLVSGATMLMPVETYGYTYYSVNYYQTTSQSSPNDWYSWAYVIASENNTRVQITPSDTTKEGWLPGQTYTVNLNKGEMYNIFGKAIFNGNPDSASKDMTGSKFVSVIGADGLCHPIAVFSGSGGIRLCRGDGGEYMHQQVFPSSAWGTRYLTYHTINNTNTDINETNRNYYRVCVQDPATVVLRNGVPLTGLIKNFYYEFMDSTGGDYINSDKPFMVAQYMTNKNQCWNFPTSSPAPPSYGDPEMFYISPIEQGQKSVLFYVSRRSSIDYVYANIFLPTAGVASLRVDGGVVPAAQIIPHPNLPSYSVALVRFVGAAAQHIIESDSTFNATVYGLGSYESYGYNVGTLINNLNNYSGIQNVNNSSGLTDTFTCKNTPLRLFVKLAYQANNIHWKLSQVTGLFPNTDSIIANPIPVGTELINGRTYYVYTLQQDFTVSELGTYYLPITFTTPVIANCNQTENASIAIVVKPGPTADFNFSTARCLTDTIQFANNSTAAGFNITGYNWLFDDNSTQLTENSSKRFTTSGAHPVRYRIIADNGCIDDTIKTITILPQPISNFGVSGAICSSDSVYITDSSLVAGGNISSWRWNFGDGNTLVSSNGNPFYHRYTNAGVYTISLVVTSNQNCISDTIRKTVTVLPNPVALFRYDRNVCVGQAIQFSDNSTVAAGVITQWQWNFGNGDAQVRTNGNPFNYSYASVGTYNVALVVKGSNGCSSDTFRLTVNVSAKPISNFTLSGKPCVDSTFLFTSATAFNPAVPSNWYWSYGDGFTNNISTSSATSHSYNVAANNIRVRHAVSVGGCPSDTTEQIINLIAANPTAGFVVLSDTLCERLPIRFAGNASIDATSWLWNFGNGTGTSVPPFSRTYSNAGDFTVRLRVVNAAGCLSAEVSKLLTIAVQPTVDAGPDLFLRPGETSIIAASIANPSAYDFLWTPATSLSSPIQLTPITSTQNDITYRIMATDQRNSCVAIDSMNVKIVRTIFVPNAFTPNRDGLNDNWRIPALAAYPDAMVTIFNRYGQKIFESKGYDRPWDGTYKGAEQPTGSYIYIIQPSADAAEILKGTVTIIR